MVEVDGKLDDCSVGSRGDFCCSFAHCAKAGDITSVNSVDFDFEMGRFERGGVFDARLFVRPTLVRTWKDSRSPSCSPSLAVLVPVLMPSSSRFPVRFLAASVVNEIERTNLALAFLSPRDGRDRGRW